MPVSLLAALPVVPDVPEVPVPVCPAPLDEPDPDAPLLDDAPLEAPWAAFRGPHAATAASIAPTTAILLTVTATPPTSP